MIPLGTLAALEAVVRSAALERPADKRQLVRHVRSWLGLQAEDPDSEHKPDTACTGAVLSVNEAAARLARTPRTIQYYAATGQLAAVRTGRSRRLSGIPASEIDAFIQRNTTQEARAQ